MPLFTPRRNLRHSPLIYFPHSRYRSLLLVLRDTLISDILQRSLFKPSVIEPHIVVPTILGEFVLVLYSTLSENGSLEG